MVWYKVINKWWSPVQRSTPNCFWSDVLLIPYLFTHGFWGLCRIWMDGILLGWRGQMNILVWTNGVPSVWQKNCRFWVWTWGTYEVGTFWYSRGYIYYIYIYIVEIGTYQGIDGDIIVKNNRIRVCSWEFGIYQFNCSMSWGTIYFQR